MENRPKSVTKPGTSFFLDKTPIAVTENHNEVYFYWDISGLKNSTLFHIDAHSDMRRGAKPNYGHFDERIGCKENYYKILSIENFIAPAFIYQIVDSMYWLNPQSDKRNLQYMGSRADEKRKLWAYETDRWLGYYHFAFTSEGKRPRFIDRNGYYMGKLIEPSQIKINEENPLILDIDLDAFCCHKHMNHISRKHDGVKNYEERINSTVKLLENLPKPSLVTLTLSKSPSFVPEEHSSEVFESTLMGLESIYGKRENFLDIRQPA